MLYVSEYEVSRHYGGPEEGGWWYDHDEFVKCLSAHANREDAEAEATKRNERAREEAREEGRPERWSVAAGTNPDTLFYVEDHPAEFQSRGGRPRYE